MDELWFQIIVSIIGATYTVISLMSAMARKNIKLEHESLKREFELFQTDQFNPIRENVGILFSKINDQRQDFTRLEGLVNNHKDKFNELNLKIDKLHNFMERIEGKIDMIRDRRKR